MGCVGRHAPCRCSWRAYEPSILSLWVSMTYPLCIFPFFSFASANNMYINVCGVDDDKKVIYPLRVSSTLVPDRHVHLVLFERNGIQHFTTIRNFSRSVGSQVSNHGHTVYCCKQCLHAYSTQKLLDAQATTTVVMRKGPSFPRIRDVDSPTSRV